MDQQSLRAFIMVVDEQSLGAAADKLFISKQALSSKIRNMETETSCILLQRTHKGVQPTPEGMRLYAFAVQTVRLWEETLQGMQSLRDGKKMKLRVGFGYLSSNHWTKEVEKEFLQKNPDILVETDAQPSDILFEKLQQKALDLVITGVSVEPLRSRYRCETIAVGEKRLWMMEDNAMAANQTIQLAQLSGKSVYCLRADRINMEHFRDTMAQQGYAFHSRIIPSGNILGTVRLLQEEDAMLLLSELLEPYLCQISGLTSRRLVNDRNEGLLTSTLSAVIRKGSPHEETAERLTAYLRDTMGQRKKTGLLP